MPVSHFEGLAFFIYGDQFMYTINHWPDITELILPGPIAEDLYRQLLEPFEDKTEAKAFWEESPSTIIILEPLDSIF